MRIYHVCAQCKHRVPILSSAPTPQELLRDRGERIDVTCTACSTSQRAETLRTRARLSPLKLGLGVVLTGVLVLVFWNFGYVALLSFAPLAFIAAGEQSAVRAYNSQSARRWG